MKTLHISEIDGQIIVSKKEFYDLIKDIKKDEIQIILRKDIFTLKPKEPVSQEIDSMKKQKRDAFFNTIKWPKDAVEYQREVRDEW